MVELIELKLIYWSQIICHLNKLLHAIYEKQGLKSFLIFALSALILASSPSPAAWSSCPATRPRKSNPKTCNFIFNQIFYLIYYFILLVRIFRLFIDMNSRAPSSRLLIEKGWRRMKIQMFNSEAYRQRQQWNGTLSRSSYEVWADYRY